MIDNRNTAPSAVDHLTVGTFSVNHIHAGSCFVSFTDPCVLCYFIEIRKVFGNGKVVPRRVFVFFVSFFSLLLYRNFRTVWYTWTS